ncbi:MAG: diguanylate cyclase [Oceanospirillales bacterium]|nr:diguanylate cyclase [Oceanospirillales bacterium]
MDTSCHSLCNQMCVQFIRGATHSFEKQSGYLLAEVRGKHPEQVLYGTDTDPATLKRINEALSQRQESEEDVLQYTRAGTPYWVHSVCIPVGRQPDLEPGFVVIQNNISDHTYSARSMRIAASVFDRSHEAILITDRNNRILDVNPAFSRITGYSRDEVLGQTPSILSSGRHSQAYYRSMWQSIEKHDYWRGEIWNRRKNGEEYAELLSISRVHLGAPGQYYHVAAFSDITALKNHARELSRAANYDELTGLPNRQQLEARLRVARQHARRQETSLAVCYLDVDGFRDYNNQLGRPFGDRLLRTLAERLTRSLRSGDTVSRIGGDEFVILLQNDQGEAVYQRILATISEPMEIGDQTIRLTASLGVTLFPKDSADAEGLIRHADQAMYSAKEKGRNQYHIFDPDLDEYRRQRRNQLMELSRALEHGELELFFQPQVRVSDNALIGFEALIRWRHPEHGLLLPHQFLPAVADSHLETPLGQWMLKEALQQLNLWRAAGESLGVSINISVQHLLDRNFVPHLEDYLHSHPDVDPGSITLEVLETAALKDLKRASEVLTRCQGLGLQVALDDFGTGFSSLTYLRTLPVDLIKIDQSFVLNMLDDASDRAIVESVIFLAQRFAHPVLAEGVETMEHASVLREMGCNLVQGFGIARPMPAADTLAWARQWRGQAQRQGAGRLSPSLTGGEGI